MPASPLSQLDHALSLAEKLLSEVETRHATKRERVEARASRDEVREVFSGGGESVSTTTTTPGTDLDGDQSSVGVAVGSGSATVTVGETNVHAVDPSGRSIETPDMAGSTLKADEESTPIDAHTRMEHSTSTSVGIDASKGDVSLGLSNSTTRVDFDGDDPTATAKENEEKRAARTRTQTQTESVQIRAGPDGAAMTMEFKDSDSQTGITNSTSMGAGFDSDGNVSTRVGEKRVEKNDMEGTDTTATSGSLNLSTGEVTANRSTTSVDSEGAGSRVDIGGGVNAKEGKANLSLGATGLEADPDDPGKSQDTVRVKATGAIDTHLDDGRGLGVSGEFSQDIKGFTLSIGGGYDFVVYNPELDRKTGIVTVRATVQSSVKGGGGLKPGGTGISGAVAQVEGKELVKKFDSMTKANAWFDQPREKILKEMAGFEGTLDEGESRGTSESLETTAGGAAKIKAVDIGYEETSKTELGYKETGGKDGQITITIIVKESGSATGSAGASVGAVDATIGQTESSSEGRSYDFVLSQKAEDFEALRKILKGAKTVAEVEKLRDDPRFKDHVGKETISSSEASTTDFQTGAAKGALSVGTQQRSEKTSSVTRDKENLSGEFSGKQGTKLEGSLAGVKAGVDIEEGAKTSLNAAGDREVDLQRQVNMEGLLGWIASYKKKLSGFKVNDKDFKKVEARAKDARKWGWCNCYPRVDAQDAWKNLRKHILQPRTTWDWFDPEWADLDMDMLRKLLQMAEVADYMGSYASKGGHDGWVNMLRNWGQRPGLAAEHSNAEDLGAEYEWQSALKKEQDLYYTVETQVEFLSKKIDPLFQAFDVQGAENLCNPLLRDIATIRKGISSFDGFDSKRALMEMLTALDNMENTVRFELSRLTEGGQSTAAGHDDQMRIEIQQILTRCARSKTAEKQLLKKMRDEFSDEIVPESESYFDTGMALLSSAYAAVTPNDSIHYWDEVIELYDKWIIDIRSCRKLYETTSISVQEWEISADGKANRNDTLEPDAREFIRLAVKAAWDKKDIDRRLSRYLSY